MCQSGKRDMPAVLPTQAAQQSWFAAPALLPAVEKQPCRGCRRTPYAQCSKGLASFTRSLQSHSDRIHCLPIVSNTDSDTNLAADGMPTRVALGSLLVLTLCAPGLLGAASQSESLALQGNWVGPGRLTGY